MEMHDDTRIDTPFQYKNNCWFCGEPYQYFFTFPHDWHIVIDCPHPKISVPCCKECLGLAQQAKVDSIYQVHYQVKILLHRLYKKDLAIGINWTPEELANSGFEGGNFASFQKSAWFMYEVAKGRVNFKSWPLVYQGVKLNNSDTKPEFSFDGVTYPNIDLAIEQYVQSYGLNKDFFIQVLNQLGREGFAAAVRFCRLYINATPQERSIALQSLADE